MKFAFVLRMILAAVLQLGAAKAMAADIIAFCESFPPYSYEEDGRQLGMSVDVLKETCIHAGITCEIRFVPWARAYHETLNTPNTLLFTTVRTALRESQFSWVGPIGYREAWLFALTDSPVRVKDAKEIGRYKIGVVSNEATYQELLGLGIPPSSFDVSTSNEILTRKLLHGRVDMMASTPNGIATLLIREGSSYDKVRKVFQVSRAGYYFALNPGTDAELTRRLARGFAEVASSGYVKEVIARYHLLDVQP